MSPDDDLLTHVRIASSCAASWDEMEGDDLVRFCRHCRKHVYNLSWMDPRDAVAFVRETGDRLRVRFFRRGDGTLLADDCPVGWCLSRRRLLARIAAACSLLSLGTLLAFHAERPAVVGRAATPPLSPLASPSKDGKAKLLFAESELPGQYYLGDGLGVNCSLELHPDHRFRFVWRGCLGMYDRNQGT
jgi:hypothetical protein